MKVYTFPYGGSTGQGDTWDSEIDYELTDKEATRLEASAKAEPRWYLDEDDAISDIYNMISQFIFDENKRMMIMSGSLKEARETWEYFHRDEANTPSDDELVKEEMGNWHVCYPKGLQLLDN